MRKPLLLLVLIVIALFVCHNASADVILLKNGKLVEGRITHVRGIFIRVDPGYDRPFREFLIENIANIEEVSANEISLLAVRNIHQRAINASKNRLIEESATKRAAEIIGEAILNTEINFLGDASAEVQAVAQQKASTLISEAVKSVRTPRLNETPAEVRAIAKEKAGNLIEQAVKVVEEQPLRKAPISVQIAAKKAATVLIEEAAVDPQVRRQVNPSTYSSGLFSYIARELFLMKLRYLNIGIPIRDQVFGGLILLMIAFLFIEKQKNKKRFMEMAQRQVPITPAQVPGKSEQAVVSEEEESQEEEEESWYEKRDSPRVDCDFPLSLIFNKMSLIPVVVKNISMSGAFAICKDIDLLRRLGDQCQFQFGFTSDESQVPLIGKAEVVRIKSDREIGIKFSELSEESLNSLHEFQGTN